MKKPKTGPERQLAIIAESLDTTLQTAVGSVAQERRDPFFVLLSTIISLRTKDEVTHLASQRLFRAASDPAGVAALPLETIEQAIYPAGFYRNKAKQIRSSAHTIVEQHGGKTPDDLEALTALPGVGRKTANLVLGLGFGIPAVCVDIHVHRISNRLGWVETTSPEATERELMHILPQKLWIPVNDLLVRFGQGRCKPVSPHCSSCPLTAECPKIGVTRKR